MFGWHGPSDGLVEIWNGMPFFSPVWARGRAIVFLHHVHDEMWEMTLPPRLARSGSTLESRIAPPLYRRTPIVTLSESSKRELVDELRLPRRPRHGRAAGHRRPLLARGRPKSPTPLVVAVGRLVPVKRFDELIDVLVAPARSGSPTSRP